MSNTGLRMIMLQNAKGTGDIFQVGAALCCDAELGVLVISAEDDKTGSDKPGMIIPHYLRDWQIDSRRVTSMKVVDPEKAIKSLTQQRNLAAHGGELSIATVGHATNILLTKLGTNAGMERLVHFRKLLLSQADVEEQQLGEFLERKGVKPKQDIVVLWSRSMTV